MGISSQDSLPPDAATLISSLAATLAATAAQNTPGLQWLPVSSTPTGCHWQGYPGPHSTETDTNCATVQAPAPTDPRGPALRHQHTAAQPVQRHRPSSEEHSRELRSAKPAVADDGNEVSSADATTATGASTPNRIYAAVPACHSTGTEQHQQTQLHSAAGGLPELKPQPQPVASSLAEVALQSHDGCASSGRNEPRTAECMHEPGPDLAAAVPDNATASLSQAASTAQACPATTGTQDAAAQSNPPVQDAPAAGDLITPPSPKASPTGLPAKTANAGDQLAAAASPAASPTAPAVQPAELGELERVAQAVQAAPSYGLNARALILQAARLLSEASEEDGALACESHADAAHSSTPSAASMSNAEANLHHREGLAPSSSGSVTGGGGAVDVPKLWAAVPLAERPMVAYVQRPRVPRVNRQKVLDRLAGQHLALAVTQKGDAGDGGAALMAADVQLRRAALAAAVAQELDLYKRAGSKLVYLNLAARMSATLPAESQPAMPVTAAPTPTPAAVSIVDGSTGDVKPSSGVDGPPGSSPAAATHSANAVQPEAFATAAEVPPDEPAAAQGEQQDALVTEQPASAAAAAILQEDDIDWSTWAHGLAAGEDAGTGSAAADHDAAAGEAAPYDQTQSAAQQSEDAVATDAADADMPQTCIGGAVTLSAAPCSSLLQLEPRQRRRLLGADGLPTEASTSGASADAAPGGRGDQQSRRHKLEAWRQQRALEDAPSSTPTDEDAPSRKRQKLAVPGTVDLQQRHLSAGQVGDQPAAAGGKDEKSNGEAADGAAQGDRSGVVGDAVRRFVRAHLDPLFAAGVIDREVYKVVAKKVLNKVLQNHQDAPNADFLIAEGDAIRKLVQKYIQFIKRVK